MQRIKVLHNFILDSTLVCCYLNPILPFIKLKNLPFTQQQHSFYSPVFINSHSSIFFPQFWREFRIYIIIHTHLIVAEETMTGDTESGVVNEYGDGVAWIRGSMIGKGSYGRVYLANLKNPASRYSFLPQVIAVKSAEVSSSSSIQKEMEVLCKLKGCPNLIDCYGSETTVGDNGLMAYNLLLEYCSGGNLADRIEKSGGGLPEFEVKFYARSILRGLKHVHRLGYVHCDLKPDNVLLSEKIGGLGFRAKIGDFGLTKRGNSKKRKLEPSSNLRGTPMYLSPEAVIDNVQESACDVWAFGCIVLEMLTGKTLFDGDKELGADGILRKIGGGGELVKIPSELSKEAKAFLKGCFVKNPMFRWSAEMLLCHKFLEGLDDDDDDKIEESEGFASSDIGSITLVSESCDELSCDEWSDGDEEGSFSSCSWEDDWTTDDDLVSSCDDEKGYCDESTEMPAEILLKRRKYDHVSSFGIHVGM